MKLWKKIVAQILSVAVIMGAGAMDMKIQAEERYNISLSASGNEVAVNFDNPGVGSKMKFSVSDTSVLEKVKFSNDVGMQLLSFSGSEAIWDTPLAVKSFGFKLEGSIEKDFSLSVELLDQNGAVVSNTSSVSFSKPAANTPENTNNNSSNSDNNSNNNNENSNSTAETTSAAAKTCAAVVTPDLFQIRTNVDKATLYWKAMSGVVSYKISYGQRPNERLKTLTIPSPATTGNAMYTLTGLEVDTTYYFTMVAVDECGKESRAAVVLAGKTYNRVATFYKYK